MSMKTWVDRLKQATREKGWSLAELARQSGVSKDSVDKYAQGRVENPRGSTLAKLSKALEVPEVWLRFGNQIETKNTQRLFSERTLDILGGARGGVEGAFVDNGTPLGETMCPTILTDVKTAYAVYVVGDSMEPRYFNGELAFVNPEKPINRGNFVVVQYDKAGERQYIIKQYVKKTHEKLVFLQLNPEKELEIASNLVHSVHRVVGSIDG